MKRKRLEAGEAPQRNVGRRTALRKMPSRSQWSGRPCELCALQWWR